MHPPLLRKFASFTRLSVEESAALAELLAARPANFDARRDIFREGETPDRLYVVTAGWACRYRALPDGRRTITGFLLPGDCVGDPMAVVATMDHAVATLSPVVAAELAPDALAAVAERSPRLSRALWWDAHVAAAIQREWTVSVGRRDATERMAHLFTELFFRLRAVGLVEYGGFDMPATQNDLADALGITTVHTNRMLQQLRAGGLLTLERKRLVMRDIEKLARVAMFDDRYLHLDTEGRGVAWSET